MQRQDSSLQLRWPNEIIYQIFPERFCDGDPSLTVQEGDFLWHGKPSRRSKDPRVLTSRSGHQHTFFGGDLAGIRSKIPYLLELGVTAVYLTPIFASKSTHKYDTDDYFRIDPHFGSLADYEALVEELHRAGLKLILDGVFNHTSFEHPWYREDRENHYRLRKDGQVCTWMGGNTLPKLDTDNPRVADALAEVVACWKGVDGWRLDASHLLPKSFLRKLRHRFEEINPEGVLIGEEWEHAGNAIREGLYDGVSNFLFRRPLEAFFKEDLAAESLVRRLSTVPETYPWHGVVQSWNLLDNHDTGRFFSELKVREDRLAIAVALQFTLPGTPLVYYGDEIGLRGKDARQSRAPMIWEKRRWNKKVFDLYKRSINLRKAHPVLATGSLRWLHASNEKSTFAFAREDRDERIVVLVNAGEFDQTVLLEGRRIEAPAGAVEVVLS